MTTQSNWRSNGAPRWGPGSGASANNVKTTQAQPAAATAAATTTTAAANVAQAQPQSQRSGSATNASQSNAATNTNGGSPSPASKSVSSATPYANILANAKSATSTSDSALQAAAPADDESVQHDRTMFLLVALIGNTIVATTRSGTKHVGILSATSTAEENGGKKNTASLGVVLSCAQQIMADKTLGALKKTLIIKGEDLQGFSAYEVGLDIPVSAASSNRSNVGFRTDTEISSRSVDDRLGSQGRELHKWTGGPETDSSLEDGHSNDRLAGSGKLGSWDQFAANEAKFGIKSNYEETMYTTKLDKSGADYKERERKADQLAREIMDSTTANDHIAEERRANPEANGNAGQQESGQSEEDKYGAVVRNANAYVPPGARRAAAAAAAATASASVTARINGGLAGDKGDGAKASGTPAIVTTAPSADSPALDGSKKSDKGSSQQPQQQGAVDDFRQFVVNERERMERKKAALAKKEKESMLAGLRDWSDKFKLKYPVPNDVAMAQSANDKSSDSNLQKDLGSAPPTNVSKESTASGDAAVSRKDAASRGSASVNQTPKIDGVAGVQSSLAKMTVSKIPPFNPDKAARRQSSIQPSENANTDASVPTNASTANVGSSRPGATNPAAITLPVIPPFNPEKARARKSEVAASSGTPSAPESTPLSLTSSKSAFKMSAKASTFTPFNPNASSFTPNAGSSRVSVEASPSLRGDSPAVKPALSGPTVSLPVATHPFFGTRVIRKSATTKPPQVREDFNPFKTSTVPDASKVTSTWGFTGKSYRNLFHTIPASNGGEESASGAPGPPQQQQPHGAPVSRAGAAQAGGNAVTSPGMPPGGQGQAMHPLPGHLIGQASHHQPQVTGQPMGAQHGHAGGMPHVGQPGQPIYLPYGPYRFPAGQQAVQHLGGPYMAPQFMGQVPFSPPLPHVMPPGGTMYSPQMQNMMPAGGAAPPPPPQNMIGGVPPPGVGQAPPPPQQQQRGGQGGMPPPPHMQQAAAAAAAAAAAGKGVPPHLYYQAAAAQPMPGMAYGAPFHHHPSSGGPSPIVRHQQQQHLQHPPQQPMAPSSPQQHASPQTHPPPQHAQHASPQPPPPSHASSGGGNGGNANGNAESGANGPKQG